MPTKPSRTKVCTHCQRDLPLTDYYKCANGKLGRGSWCKTCSIARKKSAAYREKHNQWQRQPKVRKIQKLAVEKYCSNPANKDKQRARWAVSQAIKNGKLVRPSHCELCGCPDKKCVDGRSNLRADHHLGYSEEHWLSIQFVCADCDGELEKSRGTRKRHQT